MRIRHAWLVVMVLLAPAGARADNHWGDVRAAASYSAGSSLVGIQLTGTKTLGKEPPRLSDIVLDLNYQHGDHVNQWAVFGGFRRTLVHEPYLNTQPFIQVLAGAAQDHHSPRIKNWDAMLATGLGIEFLRDKKKKDGTYKETLIAWRAQFDWIASLSGDIDPYARFSFGIVLRFKECNTKYGKILCPLPVQ